MKKKFDLPEDFKVPLGYEIDAEKTDGDNIVLKRKPMLTRKERDHLRYMAQREERKAKQREYYKTHREYYLNYMKQLSKKALRGE